MKKLLYYSPFIPFVGFITHSFWIIFEYDIYSMNEYYPKCYVPMILQGLYIGFSLPLIINTCTKWT